VAEQKVGTTHTSDTRASRRGPSGRTSQDHRDISSVKRNDRGALHTGVCEGVDLLRLVISSGGALSARTTRGDAESKV